ncbi:hypothetical protein H2200_006915 [Cladophialophora chaetospira]|uniref:Uncharacterized protein n=1 Tax=Cladophialophora chaetospira TaxID=386627 RepID=A0AA38X9P3_9EURO|nr:hypothetical protein H2200_006915 [Cladophialophora chaetospira]
MATCGGIVRGKAGEKNQYFDEADLKMEVTQDLRFPRLVLRPSGQVISVPMAARILYLLSFGHNASCIVCHTKEEWNRIIALDDIQAVLNKDFDVTDADLPGGHKVVPPGPIADPEYSQGLVVPEGIYNEIVAMGGLKTYSRTNVVSYLFHNMNLWIVYPESPFEPVNVSMALPHDMHRLMLQRLKQRRGQALRVAALFPEFLDYQTGALRPEDEILPTLVPAILNELRISASEAARRVFTDYPMIPESFAGFTFYVNHMRLNRGAPEIYSSSPRNYVESVVAELLLSSKTPVKVVLGRRVERTDLPTEGRPLQDLADLLAEISTERKNPRPVSLNWACGPGGLLQFVSATTFSHALHSTAHFAERHLAKMSGPTKIQYCQSLEKGRVLTYAMLETHAQDEFAAERFALEEFVRQAAREADLRSTIRDDLQKAAEDIHDLVDLTRALAVPGDWFAVVLTAAALAHAQRLMVGGFDWCRVLLTIPDIDTMRTRAIPTSIWHPRAAQDCKVLSLPRFPLDLWNENAELKRNLKRMRGWNAQLRMGPVDLWIMESLLRDCEPAAIHISMRWTDVGLLNWPLRKIRGLSSLTVAYFEELNELRNCYDQILISANELANGPNTKHAYSQWLIQHYQEQRALCKREDPVEASPVASELDFTRARGNLSNYTRDLRRAASWYNAYGMLPLPRVGLDESLFAAESAMSELEYAQIRGEEEMWRTIDELCGDIVEDETQSASSSMPQTRQEDVVAAPKVEEHQDVGTIEDLSADIDATETQYLPPARSADVDHGSQVEGEILERVIEPRPSSSLATAEPPAGSFETPKSLEHAAAGGSAADQEGQHHESISGRVVFAGLPECSASSQAPDISCPKIPTATDNTSRVNESPETASLDQQENEARRPAALRSLRLIFHCVMVCLRPCRPRPKPYTEIRSTTSTTNYATFGGTSDPSVHQDLTSPSVLATERSPQRAPVAGALSFRAPSFGRRMVWGGPRGHVDLNSPNVEARERNRSRPPAALSFRTPVFGRRMVWGGNFVDGR